MAVESWATIRRRWAAGRERDWAYVALLDGPVADVLQRLRWAVFESGNWVSDLPDGPDGSAVQDPDAAARAQRGTGTCSILDMVRGVSPLPAPLAVSPLTRDQVRAKFGTYTPMAQDVEPWLADVDFADYRERWQGFYLVADDGWDMRVYFAGSSGAV